MTLRGPELPHTANVRTFAYTDYAARFGASSAAARKVAEVLSNYGLTIYDISPVTRTVRVGGPISKVTAAFQTDLWIYRDQVQGNFRAREGDILVPREINHLVSGVFGLDERQMAWRQPNQTIPHAGLEAHQPLTPSNIERLYEFPRGNAKGQRIAIAEFGGGLFRSDLHAYCNRHGCAIPSVNVISVGLRPQSLRRILALPTNRRTQELNNSTEVMVDVEIVAGLCSEATIDVYFAPSSEKGWIDLLSRILRSPKKMPVAISISWGAAEDSSDWSPAGLAEISTRLHCAALLGITVCVASGDNGSGDRLEDNRAHVEYPSSSPYALSVGGTMLVGDAANPREEVWWVSPGREVANGGATGGGVSVLFPRPPWQNIQVRSLDPVSTKGRIVPDVAAIAGPPSYDLVFRGRKVCLGGTSAAAPLWAALIARINARLPVRKRQRFLAPLLYSQLVPSRRLGESVCKDIVVGQNGSWPSPGLGYSAGAGFDSVSGWGSPRGRRLLAALARI